MEYEACYTWRPEKFGLDDARPAKRRRIQHTGLHASWPARKELLEQLWTVQEERLVDASSRINESAVANVKAYIDTSYTDRQYSSSIPAGLITLGPSPTAQTTFFDELRTSTSHTLVQLSASEASNLKSTLTLLIARATSNENSKAESPDDDHDGDEHDEDRVVQSKGKSRLLKYDLQILANAFPESRLGRVVITFQDSEAWDGPLLSDIIDVLSMWTDRIPIVLLFGIATSIDSLQAKLSRKAVRCIQGTRFDTVPASRALETAFGALRSPSVVQNKDEDEVCEPWMGGGLWSVILARHRDHVQSLQDVLDSIKYAYINQFYANATTLFLTPGLSFSDVPADHIQALRNLPSFKLHAESLLQDGNSALLRMLLTDDAALFDYARNHISAGCASLHEIWTALHVLLYIGQVTASPLIGDLSRLYTEAFTGRLAQRVPECLVPLRGMSSDRLTELLDHLRPFADSIYDVPDLTRRLSKLLSTRKSKTPIVPSSSSTLKTTITPRGGVGLAASSSPGKISKVEAEYLSILAATKTKLQEYLDETLLEPAELVFNEIFLFERDRTTAVRAAFEPKTRGAVERALDAPADYLGDLGIPAGDPEFEGQEEGLDPRHPATSLLYALYLESGALINVADLRSVFLDLMASVNDDEAQCLALFQRSLAELSYMGLVKGTRRRADHIVKLAWKGL